MNHVPISPTLSRMASDGTNLAALERDGRQRRAYGLPRTGVCRPIVPGGCDDVCPVCPACGVVRAQPDDVL